MPLGRDGFAYTFLLSRRQCSSLRGLGPDPLRRPRTTGRRPSLRGSGPVYDFNEDFNDDILRQHLFTSSPFHKDDNEPLEAVPPAEDEGLVYY